MGSHMMAMMKMTKAKKKIETLRREHPELSPRGIQIMFVRSMKCSKCGAKRMDPGPDQDRWRLTCRNCGQYFRLKVPKGFL